MPNSLLKRPPSVSKIWYFSCVPCHTACAISWVKCERSTTNRSIGACHPLLGSTSSVRRPMGNLGGMEHGDSPRQLPRAKAGRVNMSVRSQNLPRMLIDAYLFVDVPGRKICLEPIFRILVFIVICEAKRLLYLIILVVPCIDYDRGMMS